MEPFFDRNNAFFDHCEGNFDGPINTLAALSSSFDIIRFDSNKKSKQSLQTKPIKNDFIYHRHVRSHIVCVSGHAKSTFTFNELQGRSCSFLFKSSMRGVTRIYFVDCHVSGS